MNQTLGKLKRDLQPRKIEATRLDMLISHYHSIDDQLRREIEADRQVDAIQVLDAQLQTVLQNLKSFRAESDEEAFKHLNFFLGCGAGADQLPVRPVDTSIMRDLLTDYLLEKPGNVVRQSGQDVPQIIDNSINRISLIDMDFKYQYTSYQNAAHYGCQTSEICGKHVAEIIGPQRFLGRARGFFERCFDGETVEYAHTLDASDTTSFLKCTMQPHYDNFGTVQGAIVTMTDISKELLRGVDGMVLEPIADNGERLSLT